MGVTKLIPHLAMGEHFSPGLLKLLNEKCSTTLRKAFSQTKALSSS